MVVPSRAALLGSGSLAFILDFWSRVRDLHRAAIEQSLPTEAARRAATVSLVAQVADAGSFQRELEQARAANSHAIALLVGTDIDLPRRTDLFGLASEPVRAFAAGLPSESLVPIQAPFDRAASRCSPH